MSEYEPMSKQTIIAMSSADFRKRIDDEYVDMLNAALTGCDEEMVEDYKDSLFSYQNVLSNGRYKIEDYISAVKYVAYKRMNYSNQDSYTLTFPERAIRLREKYSHMIEEEIEKKISAFVYSYNGSKLVNEIYRQTHVAPYILNYANFQIGVNTQTHLALHGSTERIRSDAADSLMNHLAAPEAMKHEIDVSFNDGGQINELRKVVNDLSVIQQNQIATGVSTTLEIAESIIIAEIEE